MVVSFPYDSPDQRDIGQKQTVHAHLLRAAGQELKLSPQQAWESAHPGGFNAKRCCVAEV
jgi:hypothetical protein